MNPLFKKGDKSDLANYMPISLTCILCKVMEYIVASNRTRHLNVNNILYELQHGFREKGSCEAQLIQLIEDLGRHLIKGQQVDLVLLDFNKILVISDSRIRYIVSKGPKYRFPSRIDFKKCREEIASALNDFGNRWCKREYVEPDALKEWKVSIFKIVDQRIKFYSQNTNPLPPKPKSTFRHLKQGIQDFHRKYVLVPADKAANNVVVV